MYKFTCSAPQNRVPPFVETSRRPVTTHCLRLADEDDEQREERLGLKRGSVTRVTRAEYYGVASQRADEAYPKFEDRLGKKRHWLRLADEESGEPGSDEDDEQREDRLGQKRVAGAFFSSARKTVVVFYCSSACVQIQRLF